MILSAGASSRMGRPKALLPYREGTFLEHLIEVTRHPRISVTRVVLGAGAEVIRAIAKLDASVVVLNPDWEQGQLSSICAGIRSLEGIETDGIVLCPVDHPLVSARLVSELIERFYRSSEIDRRSYLQRPSRASGYFFERVVRRIARGPRRQGRTRRSLVPFRRCA